MQSIVAESVDFRYARAMMEHTNWQDYPLAIVDVETTGLDPENDRVIEIAVVHMVRGKIEDVYCTLVNPEREIPPETTEITGIKQEELNQAAPFRDIVEVVREKLEGRAFVAYNLPFDRAFIKNEFQRHDVQWDPSPCIDPLVFARELHRQKGSKRLTAVAERLGIELESAHRASDDAQATGHVLYTFAPELPQALDELLVLQSQWAQQQENEMANWRKGPSRQIDEGMASLGQVDRGNALGPAYVYGVDTDPVRAMFVHLPDSGSQR